MIHYTLLPEKELRTLKREYRVRLFITLLFFISCGILIGIGSLVPAYIHSYTEERDYLLNLKTIQKDREEKGSDTLLKELKDSSAIIARLNSHKNQFAYSQMISQIISYKNSGVTLNSFQLSSQVSTQKATTTATSTLTIILQGKALTREGLVNFKNKIENDPLISNVDLPVSDLAKSKDIPFSMKIIVNNTDNK